jgi:hypothetical protein
MGLLAGWFVVQSQHGACHCGETETGNVRGKKATDRHRTRNPADRAYAYAYAHTCIRKQVDHRRDYSGTGLHASEVSVNDGADQVQVVGEWKSGAAPRYEGDRE